MTMTRALAHQPVQPPPTLATVADVMRPPLTTADTTDHAAAAAYLMKHAGATALIVLAQNGQPAGIITEANIAHAVADGEDLNETRIYDLMTTRPAVINPATSITDAAKIMTSGHFRHMPVIVSTGLIGIVDIIDVCRALIDPGTQEPRTAGTAQ
jgi:CBS domain-containing protein